MELMEEMGGIISDGEKGREGEFLKNGWTAQQKEVKMVVGGQLA